jgi:hypothetical protein
LSGKERLFNLSPVLTNTEFAGGERGDNEALSAQTKALLDIDPTALFICTFVKPVIRHSRLFSAFFFVFSRTVFGDFLAPIVSALPSQTRPILPVPRALQSACRRLPGSATLGRSPVV